MLVIRKQRPVREKLPLAEWLMFVAVAFVPFQQALTVSVGFPLKISEVTGLLAVALMVYEGRRGTYKFHGGKKIAVMALVLFASTCVNIMRELPTANPEGYNRGLTADIIQYTLYGGIVLLVCWFAATRLGPEKLAAGISVAIRLAAAYSVVQVGAFLAGTLGVLSAVNGRTQFGSAYGIRLPRNGPFLEGNYFGFFAGIALFIMLRRKDKLGAVLAAACLLYSQSTTGVLGAAAGLLILALLRPTGKLVSFLALLGAGGALAAAFIPAASSYVAQQLGKLGLGETDELSRNIGLSMTSRTVNTDTGFAIAFDNPFLGVGPGRYGAWYEDYTNFAGLSSNFNANIERPIANNSYVQIFSELGLIAGAAFVLLLLGLFWRYRTGVGFNLGLVAFLAVGLNATPAWTVLPIWFAIAYLATAEVEQPPQRPQLAASRPRHVSVGHSERLRLNALARIARERERQSVSVRAEPGPLPSLRPAPPTRRSLDNPRVN